MKRILSCSFGKDSLTMLLLCLEKEIPIDEVIFYDTGMEFNSIYKNRDKVKKMLLEKGIDFTELKPERPFIYDMLIKPIKYRDNNKDYPYHYGYNWCGGGCRLGYR